MSAIERFLRIINSPMYSHMQGPNTPSLPSQIELTLITARPPTSVRAFVEQVANHLDLTHLRKISAVCISDPTSTNLVLQSTATSGGHGTSGDYGSGGQIEPSQQFGCGSPSELSKYDMQSLIHIAIHMLLTVICIISSM